MGFLVGGRLSHRCKIFQIITLGAPRRRVLEPGVGNHLKSFDQAIRWHRQQETRSFLEMNQICLHPHRLSSGEGQTLKKEVSDRVLRRET